MFTACMLENRSRGGIESGLQAAMPASRRISVGSLESSLRVFMPLMPLATSVAHDKTFHSDRLT